MEQASFAGLFMSVDFNAAKRRAHRHHSRPQYTETQKPQHNIMKSELTQ